MKQAIRLCIAGLIAFFVMLIARFPAKWAAAALPDSITCAQIGGSLWKGSCAQLVMNGMPIGDVAWDLQLLRLFTGKLSADLALSHVAGTVRTGVDYGLGGNITARNLKANVALDRLMLPSLPTNNVRGTVVTDLALLRLDGRVVEAAQGLIELRGLEQRTGTPLGDYRVTFPGSTTGEPVGALTDAGGPFEVQGKVRLTREPGWALDLLVAARADAPAPMRRQIEFLGSPDAQGRRPLSMSGTY